MDFEGLRRFAGGLPEAEEYDHGGRPSFRVRGRPRFASGLDDDGISLMLGEEGIREAVAEWPHACAEHWHGPELAAVRVDYRALPDEVIVELVTDAWARRARVRVLKEYRKSH